MACLRASFPALIALRFCFRYFAPGTSLRDLSFVTMNPPRGGKVPAGGGLIFKNQKMDGRRLWGRFP
jgi:hypothetical protein